MTDSNAPALDPALVPERGTRPANRRQLILAAAAELFARHGYDRVSMGDIAEAVAVTPGSLYRHVPSKPRLLAEIILGHLQPLEDLVVDQNLAGLDELVPRLAAQALDSRNIGVLWHREARHLEQKDRARVRARMRTIECRLSDHLAVLRPDLPPRWLRLLARMTLAVLTSPSFHRLDLPRNDYEALLAELGKRVTDASLPPEVAQPENHASVPGLAPASRREALLYHSVRMFADHGYAAVRTEDVARQIGMSGPSLYHHVPTKVDLLRIPFQRGTAVLFTDLAVVRRHARDPADGLRRLTHAYATFAHEHADLVRLLLSEISHLPESDQTVAREAERTYVDEWVHLLRQVHPTLDMIPARVTVHAALTVANDAARDRTLRLDPTTPAATTAISRAVLLI